MDVEQLKQCRTCREWKDAATDFTWKRNGHGSGRHPYPDCKPCRQAAMKARYHSDPVYRAACNTANRESAKRRREQGR